MSTRERPYPHTDSANIRHLRENGPELIKDLPNGSSLHGIEKQYIFRLKLNYAANVNGVAYLVGDERRAIRKFIEENEDFVSECMDATSNPIVNNVDEFLWHLFCEEWYWDGRMDEVPSQIYSGSSEAPLTEVSRNDAGRLVAPRRVSQGKSNSVSVPPQIVDEIEMEGGEDLHIYENDESLIYTVGEFDLDHVNTLSLVEVDHGGYYSYSVTIPSTIDFFESGDIVEIVSFGTGTFLMR